MSKSYRARATEKPSPFGFFALCLTGLGFLVALAGHVQAAPPGASPPAAAVAAPPVAPAAGAAKVGAASAAPATKAPAAPTGPAPLKITEPASGENFLSPLAFAAKSYILVGTGLRKDAAIKHYAMGLYVEDAARQSFWGVYDRAGRRKSGLFFESRAQNFYTWGHFSKMALVRYLRPTPKEELQKSFRDGLSELLTPQSPAELQKDTQTFLALLDADLKDGQELRLLCDDVGQLQVYLDTTKKTGPQNPKLCRHIWDIWLGYHPVQKEMRQSLLDRLEVLAK